MEHDTGAPADRGPDAPAGRPGSDVIGSDVIGSDAVSSDGVSGGKSRSGGLPRWVLGVAGGALVLVVAGGAAAWAAVTGGGHGAGSALAAAPGPSTSPAPGQRELRDGPGGPSGDGLRGALHGRVTVPDTAVGGSGTGFRDVLVQRGTVTAASATSLALRSADGFTATYRLTAQTQYQGAATSAAGLRTGQALAVVAGTDSAALQVRDVLPPMTVRHGHRGLLGPDGDDDGPAPSGTPSAPGGAGSGGTDSGTGSAPARPSGHLPMSAPGAGPLGGAAT